MAALKPKDRNKKRISRRGRARATKAAANRWIATVGTDSTHPPEGLFAKNASTIARTLASKKVSPKGPLSGLRMLIYFINRAGSRLSVTRRTEMEKAKTLLSNRIRKNKFSALKRSRSL